MSVLDRRDSDSGVVLDGFPNGIEGIFVVIFIEQAKKAPNTRPRSVVVFRFNVYSSFLNLGGATWSFPEVGLAVKVAVQDCVLSSLQKQLKKK
jgi:hypothetical protein